jgi:hypothetical protein
LEICALRQQAERLCIQALQLQQRADQVEQEAAALEARTA